MIKKIDDLIEGVVKCLKSHELSEKHFLILQEVMEDKWLDQVTPLNYQRGKLTLGVQSSVVFQEIDQFYKQNWLTQIKQQGSPVKEIEIRLIDSLGD